LEEHHAISQRARDRRFAEDRHAILSCLREEDLRDRLRATVAGADKVVKIVIRLVEAQKTQATVPTWRSPRCHNKWIDTSEIILLSEKPISDSRGTFGRTVECPCLKDRRPDRLQFGEVKPFHKSLSCSVEDLPKIVRKATGAAEELKYLWNCWARWKTGGSQKVA